MTERHLTEEEMDALVIADVNDLSAWGEPVVVGPSTGLRRSNRAKHLELASKFYVLSVLHRLGTDATITFSHSDNVDITIVIESGNVLTVDVKTLTGPLEWPVSPFHARARHFIAFVWYPSPRDANVPPDVYIVSSDELRRFIEEQPVQRISLAALDERVHARDAWNHLAVSTAA